MGVLASLLHPLDAAGQLLVHLTGVEPHRPAVAGQDPLETEIKEALHRASLFGPGVPAGVAEGVEAVARLVPGEVVAGEEELLAPEENGVASGVAGRGDHE